MPKFTWRRKRVGMYDLQDQPYTWGYIFPNPGTFVWRWAWEICISDGVGYWEHRCSGIESSFKEARRAAEDELIKGEALAQIKRPEAEARTMNIADI